MRRFFAALEPTDKARWRRTFVAGRRDGPRLALVAQNRTTDKPVIQMRDSSSNAFIRNLNPLGANWRVTRMVNIGDADGDSGDDLSVAAVRIDDNIEVVQTLRAADGSLVSNAF